MPARRKRKARKRSPGYGSRFEKLVALEARLLSPDGCPWDREQTHQSLRTYLLEETYETLEALDSGDPEMLASELGDLLLQIVFHAELARKAGRFDIGDVIGRIHAKMVRRHPHVFGKTRARTSAQVLKNWEQLKTEERRSESSANGRSLLSGVPRNLPAVLEAYQLTRRAARIGFDWEDLDGLLEKLKEETEELRGALRSVDLESSTRKNVAAGERQGLEAEVGDLLFVVVNIARFLGVDPEIALKKANRKFLRRFEQMEQEAARQGRRLADLPRERLEALWELSKSRE